jgi:hypothetical protein
MHLIPQIKYPSILYTDFFGQELAARGICLADVRVSDALIIADCARHIDQIFAHPAREDIAPCLGHQ